MKHYKKNETTDFHLKMLSRIIDMNRYPLTKMIIEKNISETEFKVIMSLLEELNNKFHEQKEEGLLDFSTLLIHFAGMLNEKLDPTSTIIALKKEGYYPSLMNEFMKILERDFDLS